MSGLVTIRSMIFPEVSFFVFLQMYMVRFTNASQEELQLLKQKTSAPDAFIEVLPVHHVVSAIAAFFIIKRDLLTYFSVAKWRKFSLMGIRRTM